MPQFFIIMRVMESYYTGLTAQGTCASVINLKLAGKGTILFVLLPQAGTMVGMLT